MITPNILTLFRVMLALICLPLLIIFRSAGSDLVVLLLFTAASITDWWDGYLARKMHEKTVLGSYMDPIADKLLLVGGFLSLSFMNHLPPSMHVPAWVTIPIISRDIVILIGALFVFMQTGSLKAKPLFISKLTTVVQMATILASLLGVPLFLRQFFYFLVVGLTLWSGSRYLGMGGEMFMEF